jgi:hypothetical protein
MKMFFKKLRSPSSTSDPASKVQPLTSPPQTASNRETDAKSATQVLMRESSTDYELFLEKARKEAENKDKAVLKLAKEAERRRKEFNLDPWASRI